MSYVGPNTLKHFAQKYFGDPDKIKDIGDGTVTDAIRSVAADAAGAVSALGYTGKNLIPYPYDNTTVTRNEITWTDNGDGTVTANGTCNATGSSYSYFQVHTRADTKSPFRLEKGKYIVTGAPAGGSSSKWQITVGHTDPSDGTSYISDANDFGSGATFELSQDIDTMQVQLVIRPGQTVNNLVFRPMIRPAEIDDAAWEPYQETVKEQIERIDGEVSLMKNRRWYLFGDSLAAIAEGGYTTQLKSWMGDRFNFSAQGAMKYGTNAVTNYYVFTDQLDTWLPGIADKDTYTDVFVELGSNDVVQYNASNFTSGFNSAINKIKNNFPNARIHIGIVGKQMLNSIYNDRQVVINALKQQCGANGCLWAAGNENILGGKAHTFDTIHPTAAGFQYIAKALYSYMNGGGIIQATLARNTVTSGLQGLQIQEEYESGKYSVKVSGTIENSEGITIPAKLGVVGTKIGDCNLNYCYRDVQVFGFLQASISIFGTEITHQIPCAIAIIPSEDATTTCGVYLIASYQDYYRDSSGAAQPWTSGFTFTAGIFNGPATTIPA